jgi:hypothetical protein
LLPFADGGGVVFATGHGFPLVVDCSATARVPLAEWIASESEEIERALFESGALLFRNTSVESCEAFERVSRALTPSLKSYVGGGSPRTHIKGRVYTSTEYPARASIPLHCEASYLPDMPSHVYFFCQTPALKGGETPIGDMSRVIERLNPRFVERLKRDGVLYISNLHNGQGFGKSWMDTYESEDRDEVESRLATQGAAYHWRGDGGLRVENRAAATQPHPRTGAEIWVNQMVNWHPLHLGMENYTRLLSIFGRVENFPKCAFYGDGEPIEPEYVRDVCDALDAIEKIFTWREGDILLVDNMRVSHGRRPFEGPRAVYVAMA